MTLKELRLSIGARQEDVAWRCKVHRAAVSNWERGLREPLPKHIKVMAKFFMVSQDDVRAAVEESAKEHGRA